MTFLDSPNHVLQLEKKFAVIYKSLTGKKVEAVMTEQESRKIIVQLYNELESTFDSMSKAVAVSKMQSDKLLETENQVSVLQKRCREHDLIHIDKETAATKLQQTLCDLTERNSELKAKIALLERGTDTQIYEFQNEILAEKEIHIQRMRHTISLTQIQLKNALSSKTSFHESVQDLQQRLVRIKQEYDHLNQGIARHFDELRGFIKIKVSSQIIEGLGKLQLEQNLLVEEQRVHRILSKSHDEVGSIKILARIHHDVNQTTDSTDTRNILTMISTKDLAITTTSHGAAPSVYHFDRVFSEKSSQKDVYSEMEQSVVKILGGARVGVFVLGQMGSGKNYTFQGALSNEGIVFLALKQIFKSIEDLETRKNGSSVIVSASAFEIVNERGLRFIFLLLVYDLFSNDLNTQSKIEPGYYSGDARLDPPAQELVCGNLQEALKANERANISRKQTSTLRKIASSETTFIIRFTIHATESVANQIIQSHTGSISFVDSAAIPIDLKPDLGNPLTSLSIQHTYDSLQSCFRSRFHNQPITRRVSSAVYLIMSEVFGPRGEIYVILSLSSFAKDEASTVKMLEFGNGIVV
jgi:hypothetical protein